MADGIGAGLQGFASGLRGGIGLALAAKSRRTQERAQAAREKASELETLTGFVKTLKDPDVTPEMASLVGQGISQIMGVAPDSQFGKNINMLLKSKDTTNRQFVSSLMPFLAQLPQGQRKAFANLPIGEQMKAVRSAAESAAKPFTLGAGGTRFGPTGEVVAEGAAQRPLVSVEQKGEAAESKAVGKGAGEAFVAIQQEAATARTDLVRIKTISRLLDRVTTDKTAAARLTGKQLLKSVGIEPESVGLTDDVAPAEAFQGMVSQLTLQRAEALKGALSDKDLAFLLGSGPRLTLSKEGNQVLLKFAEKTAQRAREVATAARTFRRRTGTSVGFEGSPELTALLEQDLFTEQEIEQITQQIEQQKSIAGVRGPTTSGPSAVGAVKNFLSGVGQ